MASLDTLPALEPAFAAAFRNGTSTERQAEQFARQDAAALAFQLLELSAWIKSGRLPLVGPHTPSVRFRRISSRQPSPKRPRNGGPNRQVPPRGRQPGGGNAQAQLRQPQRERGSHPECVDQYFSQFEATGWTRYHPGNRTANRHPDRTTPDAARGRAFGRARRYENCINPLAASREAGRGFPSCSSRLTVCARRISLSALRGKRINPRTVEDFANVLYSLLHVISRGRPMALSEEEWLACSSTNALFAALESPSDVRLSEFNFACCRRIRWLIDDDVTLRAIAAMENAPDHATIPIEHAVAVIQFATTPHYHDPASPRCDPSRDSNAAMAVGLAVCRSLPPGNSFHWKYRLDISRLVSMYCQWAVGRLAYHYSASSSFNRPRLCFIRDLRAAALRAWW